MPPWMCTTAVSASLGRAKFGPFLHQRTSLVQQIAPPVCGFDFTLDGMRQSLLDHFVGEIAAFRRPVSERRSKSMQCYVTVTLLRIHIAGESACCSFIVHQL